MINITEEQFLNKKKSDTIVVLGSGWSVNSLDDCHWDKIKMLDSIGFNWFCKHKFEPKFYFVREQANISSRKGEGESVKKFIGRINRYKETCCIICDVSHHTKEAHRYKNDRRIKSECFILKDDKKRKRIQKIKRYMSRSPVDYGLIHGKCTLYNIMHLVKYMDYQRIIFVGIDLYNSRYFWLGRKDTRHTVKKKGQSWKDRHAIANRVLYLVKQFSKFGIPMYVTNKRSLLTSLIPYMDINDL